MNGQIHDDDYLDSAEEIGYVPHLKNIPRRKKRAPKPRVAPPHSWETPAAVAVADQTDEEFTISYQAARHEALWLKDSLQNFLINKWFDDILRMVKGGKEASVYLCRGNATSGLDLVAAKVYRPRQFRSLKNDWLYREGRGNLDESGRKITNKGMLHAMHKKTDYGRELLHTSWLEHEFQALRVLYEAGADVPRPLASDSNAILMSYYGDEVMGAPTLNDVDLDPTESRVLYERVVHNIDLMLSRGQIHGDLSAFNILYWNGKIILIDFPQTVHPDQNRSAYSIFERDVVRVSEYFQRQGVRSNPRKLAESLWTKYNQRFIPLLDPKALDEAEDIDREIWESLKNT